jgi:hypothetical protein
MMIGSLRMPDQPDDPLSLDDDALSDIVQQQTIRYFWEGAHPVLRAIRQKDHRCSPE